LRDKQLLLDLHDLWSRREKGHIVVAGGFAACLSAYYPDLSKGARRIISNLAQQHYSSYSQ
jgi:hypothetical protein